MRFVATLFVVSLLPLLPSSRAPDTQIGDWVFRLPEGMAVRTGLDGQPVLAFRDTPDNYSTTVRFAHSADLAGDDPKEAFRSWAREGREALRKSLDIEAEGDVSESTTAAGYHMLAWVAPENAR